MTMKYTTATTAVTKYNNNSYSYKHHHHQHHRYQHQKEEGSDEFLTKIPSCLLERVTSFLHCNGVTSLATTNFKLYSELSHYQTWTRRQPVFHLTLEERLPLRTNIRGRTIQPFRFLFHSIRYGIHQVNIDVITPNGRRNNSSGGGDVQSNNTTEIAITIYKKYPKTDGSFGFTSSVIFRMDQSLSTTTDNGMYLFQSKEISDWKAGHLSHILMICATRIEATDNSLLEEENKNNSNSNSIFELFQRCLWEKSLQHCAFLEKTIALQFRQRSSKQLSLRARWWSV